MFRQNSKSQLYHVLVKSCSILEQSSTEPSQKTVVKWWGVVSSCKKPIQNQLINKIITVLTNALFSFFVLIFPRIQDRLPLQLVKTKQLQGELF
jgi:hypothetical protein